MARGQLASPWASTAAPTWPWGWGRERLGLFSRQGWDWKTLTCKECMTSPQLLVNTSTTLWGLKSNLFTLSLLLWAFCRRSFILHRIAYIKTRSERILLGPFCWFYDCLWISKHFRITQGGGKWYSRPSSKLDSFLSPKCIKQIINKAQTNSRQDRWMW